MRNQLARVMPLPGRYSCHYKTGRDNHLRAEYLSLHRLAKVWAEANVGSAIGSFGRIARLVQKRL
jgi:hypothetical protein